MPGWLRVLRGMVGTGVVFATGALVVFGSIGVVGALLGKWSVLGPLMGGRLVVVAFILGLAFSGFVALVARTKLFRKLSVALGTTLGGAAGLLYWLAIAFGGGAINRWEGNEAIVNLVLLMVIGAVSAGATMFLTKKAGASLDAGEAPLELGEGNPSFSTSNSKDAVKERR